MTSCARRGRWASHSGTEAEPAVPMSDGGVPIHRRRGNSGPCPGVQADVAQTLARVAPADQLRHRMCDRVGATGVIATVTFIRILLSASVAVALAAFDNAAGAQSFGPPQRGRLELPQRYRPPPGMCRIWLDSVPANRQPAPTDCASAIRNVPPNARVVFSDSAATSRDKNKRRRKPDSASTP